MKIQKGLFFDDLDTYIIKNIVSCYKNNLELNTWEMAKDYVASFYKKDSSVIYSIKKIEVDNIYRKIKSKMKRYLDFGFIKISKNGGNEEIFELDLDKITVAKHRFSDGYKDCIILRV